MFRSKLLFDCLDKSFPFGHIGIIADERFELVSGALHPFIVAPGLFAVLFAASARLRPSRIFPSKSVRG
jgi:hypothetical protein